MKYLASDVKYIKEFLRRIQKYIFNKLIKSNKANDIKSLEDTREVVWDLSLFYISPTGINLLLVRIIFLLDIKLKFSLACKLSKR